MFLRVTKLRPDNKTGITGIHKAVPHKRGPHVKKRYKVSRADRWTVQFKCRHICNTFDFIYAVMRRREEEILENMYPNPMKSSAHQYLVENNLLEKFKLYLKA